MEQPQQFIQAEKNEWILLDNGELSPVAATKLHKDMEDEEVTDVVSNGYIFSNTPSMSLNRRDFEEDIVDVEIPRYREGKVEGKFKEYTFADKYFTSDKHTPAEIIKNIHNKHKVISDETQKYNPFIQVANRWNKENRQPAITRIIQASEKIKPIAEAMDNRNNNNYANFSQTPTFRYGGRRFVPRKFSYGSNILNGMVSGAGAGTMALPGWGTAIGAVVGGIGGAITTYNGEQRKKKDLAKAKEYMDKQREYSDKMTQNNMLGTAAQMLMPNMKHKRADYSQERNNISNATNQASKSLKNQASNNIALANSSNNTMLRAMSGNMNASQYAAMAANVASESINKANQLNTTVEGQLSKYKLDGTNRINNLNRTEKDINREYENKERLAKETKYRTGITQFTNNRTDDLSRKAQLESDYFNMKQGIEKANRAETQAQMAAFNNTLLMAGSAAAVGLDSDLGKELMEKWGSGGAEGKINKELLRLYNTPKDQLEHLYNYNDFDYHGVLG